MIGQQIRKLRKAQNISQKELAARLFVTPQAISKWEKDITTPNPEAILQMSLFFGVTADYLIGNETHAEKTATPKDGDPKTVELMKLVAKLTPDQEQVILAAIRDMTQGK